LSKVIFIHSFGGGTGKSERGPNVSAALTAMGNRVAMVDPDIQSTRIYVLFGFSDDLDSPRKDYL